MGGVLPLELIPALALALVLVLAGVLVALAARDTRPAALRLQRAGYTDDAFVAHVVNRGVPRDVALTALDVLRRDLLGDGFPVQPQDRLRATYGCGDVDGLRTTLAHRCRRTPLPAPAGDPSVEELLRWVTACPPTTARR